MTAYSESPFGVDPAGLRARFREIFRDPLIFVRELVQNAVEAVNRARGPAKTGRVDVTIRTAEGWIEVSDNGIGMSYEEAQTAVSRFFRSSWERGTAGPRFFADSDDEQPDDDRSIAIGHFGIGLTTCLMVSDEYRVMTRPSSGEDRGSVHRVFVELVDGEPTIRYQHRPALDSENFPPGTRVRVLVGIRQWRLAGAPLAVDAACLDETVIADRIRRYMALVSVPVVLNGRPIVGGHVHQSAVTQIFLTNDAGPEDEAVASLDIHRHNRDGYVRARLAIPPIADESSRIRVFSRGILVGDLPCAEIFGEHLAVFSGTLDSDLFDLQVDRNRLLDNARLRDFQEQIRLWVCEGLVELSERDWRTYVQAIEIHRRSILTYLGLSEEASLILGPRIPFQDAILSDVYRSLDDYLKETTVIGTHGRVLAFNTNRTRNHPALQVFGLTGVPVAVFDLEVPTPMGSVNWDYLYVRAFLLHAEQEISVLRIDVLIGDLCRQESRPSSARADRIVNAVAARLSKAATVTTGELNVPVPGIVATALSQMMAEEMPSDDDDDDEFRTDFLGFLLDMAHNLAADAPGESLAGRLRRQMLPTAVINGGYPAIKRIFDPVGPDEKVAIDQLTIIAATLLLTAVQKQQDFLADQIYEAVARLVDRTQPLPAGSIAAGRP